MIKDILNYAGLALGLLLSSLGIFLSIKFRRVRVPTYLQKNMLLIKDYVSSINSLNILYKGHEIQNLTSTALYIWNKGKETINYCDIAEADPLLIKTKNCAKILDASIVYMHNPANNFLIEVNEDVIRVIFDYFDFAEGIIINILHTGKIGDEIEVQGTFKGAGKIRRHDATSANMRINIGLAIVLLINFLLMLITFNNIYWIFASPFLIGAFMLYLNTINNDSVKVFQKAFIIKNSTYSKDI